MATQPSDIAGILARLERVERQNRWIKRVGVVVVILVGATFLMGAQAQRGETEAERFVVKDKNNNFRAVLGMSKGKAEAPWLLLTDEKGKGRTMLFPGRLDLADENGKRRASLFVGNEGPRLELYDEKGKVIASRP